MQFKLVGWLKIMFFVLWGKIRPKAEIRLFQAVYLCCTGEHFTVEDLRGLNHSQQTDHFFCSTKSCHFVFAQLLSLFPGCCIIPSFLVF